MSMFENQCACVFLNMSMFEKMRMLFINMSVFKQTHLLYFSHAHFSKTISGSGCFHKGLGGSKAFRHRSALHNHATAMPR